MAAVDGYMKNLPNILLVSGSGRKVGKTSLVCSILKQLSSSHQVVAVKITPHPHPDLQGMIPVQVKQGFQIFMQQQTNTRDSSRMLEAGAAEAFLIQYSQGFLKQAFEQLLEMIGSDRLYIVESGGLRDLITPGLYIMVSSSFLPEKNQSSGNLADLFLDETVDFKKFSSRISVDNGKWTLNP